MNADRKHVRRGLEGAWRATAMPVDKSPQGAASLQAAVIVPQDPEVAATPTRRRFTAEDKLRILTLADACTAVSSLGRCFAPKASTPRTSRRGAANARRVCSRP